MVDAEELAKCFDADQLRGYKPIRSFTREERRVIAAALRELRASPPRGNYEDRHPSDMVLHPLSEIREWDEALAVLGIQDSNQTPADAIRELNAEIERLRDAVGSTREGS